MERDETQQREWEQNYSDAKLDRVDLALYVLSKRTGSVKRIKELAKRYGIETHDVEQIVSEFLKHRNLGEFRMIRGDLGKASLVWGAYFSIDEFRKELTFDHAKA